MSQYTEDNIMNINVMCCPRCVDQRVEKIVKLALTEPGSWRPKTMQSNKDHVVYSDFFGSKETWKSSNGVDRRKGVEAGSSCRPIDRRHEWFSVILFFFGKEKYFMKNVFSRDMIQDNWHQCVLCLLLEDDKSSRSFVFPLFEKFKLLSFIKPML